MRALTTVSIAVIATLALTACSADNITEPSADESTITSPSSTPEPTSSAATTPTPSPSATEPARPALEVTITGDEVAPNGQVIKLATGEPITIRVSSDRDGELHVHSKPEQFVEFTKGTSSTEIVINTPGVVEVEDHETGVVVAQIEVK